MPIPLPLPIPIPIPIPFLVNHSIFNGLQGMVLVLVLVLVLAMVLAFVNYSNSSLKGYHIRFLKKYDIWALHKLKKCSMPKILINFHQIMKKGNF